MSEGSGVQRVKVTWTDNSDNESGFTVQLATDAGFKTGLITATVGAGIKTYESGQLNAGVEYSPGSGPTKGNRRPRLGKASPGRAVTR